MRSPSALLFTLALVGCPKPDAPARVELAVFSASSLTEAFTALEASFEAAHPDVDVQPTFAGSQVLRVQIEQGAPADVFASANEAHMAALAEGGLVRRRQIFAHNQLVIIVPAEGDSPVKTFEDLPKAERIVIGTPHVPVGAYTRRALAQLGEAYASAVLARVVSEESNVRLVRAKVELGEADAAVVYRTDALASKDVRPVPFPPEVEVRARYPIATLTRARHPEAAVAFVAHVLSDEGQRILARHGFSSPVQ